VTSGITLIKGAIASSTYESSWGVAATELADGAIVFMDVGFSLGNPVYNNNSATLTFTDNVQTPLPVAISYGTAPDCYMTEAHMVSAGVYTACDATAGTTVVVSYLKASGTNTTFKFRVLATLNTTTSAPCKISTAKTEDSSTILIDETTAGLASFSRGTYTN